VQPAMPREVVAAFNSHRSPVLAGQLFVKLLREQLTRLLK
jgi:hypothetical protein